MRVIPTCITQEELQSQKEKFETRGTEKEAALEGDPKCNNLIEAIVYDTKPVHFISMVSEYSRQSVKEKQCFNVETGKVLKLRLLCMNCINKYNNKM